MRVVWQILKWTGAGLLLCVALVWAGDYVSVRHRMAHKTAADPVETISVRPVYAIARKDGKDEFDIGDPETQSCVHSLFPHLGFNPCWYVKRESQKPIPIGIFIPLGFPLAIHGRSDGLEPAHSIVRRPFGGAVRPGNVSR